MTHRIFELINFIFILQQNIVPKSYLILLQVAKIIIHSIFSSLIYVSGFGLLDSQYFDDLYYAVVISSTNSNSSTLIELECF